MYKVITHTIKEEHFTHPVTVEHALLMKGGNVRPMSSANSNVPNPLKDVYRSNVRSLIEKYVYAVRSAIVSIFNASEDLPVLEEEIKKSINNIKDGIKVVFGQNTDNTDILTFAKYLTDYSTDLLDFAKAQKLGKSALDIESRMAQRIEDLCTFMTAGNSTYWTKSAIYNYFYQFGEAFKNQAMARKNKDWVKDQEYFKNAYNLFVEGIPATLVSFSQYLADGIMMDFPWVPVTMPVPNPSKIKG